MSGAQGALPLGAFTATTYMSLEGGENKTKMDLQFREDEGKIQIDNLQDKVKDATRGEGPVFGVGKEEEKKVDLDVTGIAE